MRWILLLVALCGQTLAAADDDPTPLEEVLVVGEHPGPGLWKVSKRSHSLFILGTHGPLPADLVWRSREVEAAIARSNEILGAYSVSLRVDQEGALQSTREQLKDVLPPRMYAQWRALRDKYIGDKAADSLLPAAAALLLQARAYERSGLTYSDGVWRTIYRLAQERGVAIRPQNYDTRLVAVERRRTASARKNGVKYLAETMDRLSSDIREARSRANAWATGDISALRELIAKDASHARSRAYSWPFLSDDQVQSLHREAENQLLATLERAINRNEATFAALPMHLLLGKEGVLARLRASGYRIEEPG
jgi:uncharacterized protein YbaP (TraB family)